MTFRDRIKELRRVKASDLKANPKNWRVHNQPQREAVRAVLAEVGFADALLARETDDGLELIDGHLRADESSDQVVPVLVLDVTAEEADKLLATLDPLAAMADADNAKLNDLLADLESEEAALRRLFDDLQAAADEESEGGGRADAARGSVREEDMELRPEEHYDYIVVAADNVQDWNRLVALLELPEVISKRRHQRIGMARAVHARRVLELIDQAHAPKAKKDAGNEEDAGNEG